MEEGFNLCILNADFETLCVVDKFESMIWTDRYRECGDFELYLGVEYDILTFAQPMNYLWVDSWMGNVCRLMIIENVEITTDIENGDHLKITGRSLESILARRIVWNKVTLSGTVQNVVKTLITDAIINPTMSDRKISNFVFVDNSDPLLATYTVEETQFLGENLYDKIIEILAVHDIGLQVLYNFNTGNFECSIFLGTDRSYEQRERAYIVFSPEFDSLLTSDYTEDYEKYSNVNLIEGEDPSEDSGHTKKFVYVNDGSSWTTGLNRREMFTSGTSERQDYKDENDHDVHLTDQQYIEVLRSKALEELSKKDNKVEIGFEAEVSAHNYIYGDDYFVGDIVQVINKYNIGKPMRITEMIRSQSTSGWELYPTFEALSEEDE